MSGFHYEKNLPHQQQAIESVLKVFSNAQTKFIATDINPKIEFLGDQLAHNIKQVQQGNHIQFSSKIDSNILDIAMETGTGKTYTYTKTIFELHRTLGIFKFIIVVPTVSIKAGTKSFLESQALKQHFRLDFAGLYGETEIKLYVVESKENKKNTKALAPTEIIDFVRSDDNSKIHILLINTGMVNSKTMKGENKGNDGSQLIKDLYHQPFDAIASTNPLIIIDEPHKFPKDKTTWENLVKFKPQFIIRYGATFKEYHHLLYRLTAVEAFNQNLVKGVQVFVQQLDGSVETKISLKQIENKEAYFELQIGKQKNIFKLKKGESLSQIHPAIENLFIENLNNKVVLLSNGLEISKDSIINPFSYLTSITEKMMRIAISQHFKLEREFFLRPEGKIKPITLFFIDDIKGYRDNQQITGSLRQCFEDYVKTEVENLLSKETDLSYKAHLMELKENISACHGGYFSQDNNCNDDNIEKQVNEILHDKETLLSFTNPRRFIFSKWTLREGWDNPNIFQICKLRSSGSEINKLQEVGRGLRLPVNEYMARVKDQDFKLNYFVDSSEQDFAEQLIYQVNHSVKSEEIISKLSEQVIEKIQNDYPDETKRSISNKLYDLKLIDDNDKFICEDPYSELTKLYPLTFKQNQLKKNKISGVNKQKNNIPMRVGKYAELKALWEHINQKVILQYDIKSEIEFENLFSDYLREKANSFTATSIRTQAKELKSNQQTGQLYIREVDDLDDLSLMPIKTMDYASFITKLSQTALIQRKTLISAFNKVKGKLDIENFLNERTIQQIKTGFNEFLLYHSFTSFEVGYQKVVGNVHPTKFTNMQGEPKEVNLTDLGVYQDSQKIPLENYLFDSVFFDSDIELENITNGKVKEVIVFTKIPKNAIKIPVAGGGTYSPDFAYIVKTSKGDILNLILESKGLKDSEELRAKEKQKIAHAKQMFSAISDQIKVEFKTQFEGEKVSEIIKQYLTAN